MKSKFLILKCLLCAVVSLWCSLCFGAPKIKQFYPNKDLLIGEPSYWMVEVRHPLWESYRAATVPLAGATTEIEAAIDRQEKDEMVTLYRIRIVPESLAIGGAPSITLTDAHGGVTVIPGRALSVHFISGSSLDIRDPQLPVFRTTTQQNGWLWGSVAGILLALCVFLVWRRRRRAADPKYLYFQSLQESLTEVKSMKMQDPVPLCGLLRSRFLWGNEVGAFTSAELREKENRDGRFLLISEALDILESWRYSGVPARGKTALLVKSVSAALQIVEEQ